MEKMISAKLKTKINSNLKNIPGWRTKKRIIIIESDDWGSIRMPSKKVYQNLLSAGIRVDKSIFTRLDTLASKRDLENLFNVLLTVKDREGSHPVFSPFANVANPDFSKIKDCDYLEYHYKTLPQTLEEYFSENVIEVWKSGINAKIFLPQYHGREHLNVPMWMVYLKKGDPNLLKAFENGVVHIKVNKIKPKEVSGFAPAYYFDSESSKNYLKDSIVDGALIFKEIFEYSASSFDPPNGIFHEEFEKALAQTDIRCIVTSRNRLEPTENGSLLNRNFLLKFGKKSKYGQTYYRRNCKFEPFQKNYQGIDRTLDEIQAAFNWNKPAIISTHRINFVSSLDNKHSDFALKEFELLLKKITQKWPEAEFKSSETFSSLISQ